MVGHDDAAPVAAVGATEVAVMETVVTLFYLAVLVSGVCSLAEAVDWREVDAQKRRRDRERHKPRTF